MENGFKKHLRIKGVWVNMIKESNLTKYYSQIAEKLDTMIPCDWDKIVLYGEEIGDVSSASFYFFTSDSKVHHSGNIPEEYNVSRKIFKGLLGELLETNKKLWLEFKNADEPTWCLFTFEINSDWKFKIKYGYERNNEIGRLEREIRWAYDELGIVPEDEYERELLEEYLKEQGKSL